MRQVLHKVKSQWIVVGVTGATVVSLGIANVQQVSAAEMDDVGIAGNTGQAGNPLIPNEPIKLVLGETLIEDVPNFTAEIDDSTLEEGKTEVLQDDNAPVIDSSSISVSKVEVMEGESIRVSVRITDNASIASASIAYLSPITAQTETIPLFKNEISGLFEGAFTVTDATELGVWQCSIIEAFDTQGHSALLSGSDADLSGAVFTVNETTATADTKSVTEATSVDMLQAAVASEEVTALSAAVIAPMEVQEPPVVNLATEGTVSTSVPFDNIAYATNAQTGNTAEYARGASGLQWVQVDLGASFDLREIKLWHYFGDGRSYKDVVAQLSNDATFSSGAVTVFNNDKDGSAGLGVGRDSEYSETSAGKTIVFDTLNARYARFYSNGSTVNGANHYVEIEVYGVEPQTVPTTNLIPEGTLSSSVPFDNLTYAANTQADNTAEYARGTTGLQWVQADLGASYDINEIQLWHYYGDSRSYHDVIVQLSDDATFSSGAVTVFNNDKDGSAGLGVGTDNEYSETSAGKKILFDTVTARYARFYSNGSAVNGANHYVEIEVYGVEPQTVPTVNLVPEATLSSSVSFDNLSYAADTQADNTAEYARGTTGLQWVQADLGASYAINEINLWHYYGDGRSYHDVVVQLSDDATFASGTVTVFNNDKDGSAGLGAGTDNEYSETSAGKTITFDAISARYARLYSNGSTVNGANHYVEIEVYGVEPQVTPTMNLVPEGTLSSSVKFDNISYAADKQVDDTADYARGTTGLQWVQVDLGSAYNLDEVKIWHYYGDGRSYRDVVVQLSNDAIFTNGAVTVFNNDKDGSAGLGVGTDSEYSETSAGKMISFAAVNARYARFYSNGSTVNGANHYVEIEVYGSEAEVVEVRTETYIENKIGFVSSEQKDNEILAGERVIIQIGANGYDTVTYDVMYINGVEINRAEVKRLTVAPVNEVVKVGAFIDSQVPTAIVDTQYDSERNVVNIHLSAADDDQVKYMYDPTGKVYEGNELFYSVGSNGIHEFIVVDNSGNSLTIKVDVTAIIVDTSIDYALVENRIMELLNNLRAEQGLSILIKNEILKLAADQRAIETEALFSHTRPNGTANSTIVENQPYFYNYQAFGENLVMSTYSGNEKIRAEFLFEAWVNSLGHLANMRSINYQEVGIGIHYSKGILYAVQLFGTQQVGTIAADGGGKYHRVVDGDTLWDIALTYNQTMKQLLIWNDISDANALFPGNLISIDGYNRYDKIINGNQHFASNDEFFEYVVPLAKQMAVENGLYASVMIAQMILESSWGTSDLTTLANNLFGVKGSYDGNTIVMPTWEEENGEKYLIDAGFRVYPDLAASMLDYVELLLNGVDWDTNRYAETWVANTASYEDATACLTNRYATDSDYGEKLNNLIVMNKLWQYDSE